MPYTRTTIDHRDGTLAAIVPAVGIDGRVNDFRDPPNRLAAEPTIDDVLADSFPASDPPSWNPGIARPTPIGQTRQAPLFRRLTDADDGEPAAL